MATELALLHFLQSYPKNLAEEVRAGLKQDGNPPNQDLFKNVRTYLVKELHKKYWDTFTVR